MKKFLLSLMILAACGSNPYREYEEFPIGGDKSDLVERVGSPIRSKHKNGVDIWTYRFLEGEKKIYRDVQIKNGKVIEKGENQEAREAEIEEKVNEGIKKSKPTDVPIDIEKYKKSPTDPQY